jgi:hypothetical protein
MSKIKIAPNRNRRILNCYRTNSRGVIDAQFNWIFVLIAGFVIFLFIISIIFSQKRNAEAQAGLATMNQISTLLKSKQQTADVYSEITLPRTDFAFRCDPDSEIFNIKISNSGTNSLPVEIIFAPQSFNTNKLMIWSRAFNAGFPVSVFTYITTADSIILIYNDSTTTNAYAAELFADLDYASNITHKYISATNEYSGYKHRTVVCFDSKCPTGANAEYIKIKPADNVGLFDYGNVTFQRTSQGGPKTLPYLSKAGLYGAIFSNSPEFYKCQMSRALKQFEVRRSLVGARLVLIQNTLPEGVCKLTINVTLDSEIGAMNHPNLTSDNIKALYIKSKDLDNVNTDLKLSDCPTIY